MAAKPITVGVNLNADREGFSKNRIRFETLSERLQKINIDILHTTRQPLITNSQIDRKAPGQTESGKAIELECHFQHELIRLRSIESSDRFGRYRC